MKINVTSCRLVREKVFEYEGGENLVSNSDDLYQVFKAIGFETFAEEVLGMITFDAKGTVTSYNEVSRGTLTGSLVHPREVFKRAILANASSIALAHNHPSGDVTPSQEDIGMTRRMSEAADILGIRLIDHVIIGDGNYTALSHEGLIKS